MLECATRWKALHDAFDGSGQQLDVMVEVDVGQGRCGVHPGEPCASLAAVVAESACLRFGGLQCYSGWNQHVAELPTRRERTDEVISKVQACLDHLKKASLSAAVVTGAGTGTFCLEGASGIYTELQPGSYAFMDVEYAQTAAVDQAAGHFEHSLFVASTVISDSSSHQGWLVVDAGDKAISPGAASIKVHEHPSLSFRRGGDEHGIIEGPQELLEKLKIGTQLLLIPGHCDPTMNFYDEFIGVRNGLVEEVIPIDARGPGR